MPTEVTIGEATTDTAVARCFPVVSELRPTLDASEFISRVQRQRANGYHLAFLEVESQVRAVAGYRFGESLAWGKYCYVDDLVTAERDRAQGFGRLLFDWLAERAREAGCAQLHLDSGVQRFAAHRFYLTRGMNISSHHFALSLTP